MEITVFDVDDPRYESEPVSYGLAPILNKIVDIMPTRDRYLWDVYLINMETMLRNVLNDDRFTGDPVASTINECRLLAQYWQGFMTGAKLPRKPVMVFYLPDYKNLPTQYIRPKLPAGTVDRWEVMSKLKEQWTTSWNISYDDLDVVQCEVTNTPTGWVPISVVHDVDEFLATSKLKHMTLVMTSHVAVDFHIYKYCKRFTLLESHTGGMRKPSDLGKKVFGHAEVPFNKYTHVVFGDKTLLRPQFGPKARKEVVERAKNETWLRLSETAVLSALDKMHLVNTRILTSPKV